MTVNEVHKEDVQLGKYRHFKGGIYELIEIAHHSETQEAMAVYRALYGDHGLWVRPLSMFLETIFRDKQELQRFQYIGEETD